MIPFAEADSHRFFGRDAEIDEMLGLLRLSTFLTIIGPSGSGKSSLVYAGLLPALRQSKLFGVGDWQIQTMRPGETPFSTLKAVLNTLRHVPGKESGRDGEHILLIIDQFEETFTSSGSEARDFQEALLKLARLPNFYIVNTVRADFYTDLMASPLWSLIQSHRLEVAPLDAIGLRNAIVQPAEQNGVFIESALVERLVADSAGEPGILPLIQETLVLLWEKIERRFLPMRAYSSLVLPRQKYGEIPATGLQVAIARRADYALQQLSPDHQQIARRIFLRLIQFGEGRADTRRQQRVDQLRSERDDPKTFEETLRGLADNRLITLSGDEAQTSGTAQRKVDISHEALISGWPTLQQWIAERREAELARRQLENKAMEWVRLGQGAGGLLDEIEYREADRWLNNPDAADLGYSPELMEFIRTSRGAIDAGNRQKEATQRRELKQAQALAAEQKQRADEQAQASKRFRSISVGLVAVVFLAIVLAGWSIKNLNDLQSARGNAESAVATANAAGTDAGIQSTAAADALMNANNAGNKAATQQAKANTAATAAKEFEDIAATAKVDVGAANQEALDQKATAQAASTLAIQQRDTAVAAQATAVANANLAATNQAKAERFAGELVELSPRMVQSLLADFLNTDTSDVGDLGGVKSLSNDWTILAEKNNTAFAISREYGQGKVFAVGHDGVLTRVNSTQDFLKFAFIWLNGTNDDPRVLISTGHCEWVPNIYPLDGLKKLFGDWGYKFMDIGAPLRNDELEKGNILIIGNAWEPFNPLEIESVRQFVDRGGGLFVAGLGWSWDVHGSNNTVNPCHTPETDFSRYPMNLLVNSFNMQWIRDQIP